MRPVATRKNDNKNQLITNNNYDQNCCPFLKTSNNQIEMPSEKTYSKQDYPVPHWRKIWDFSSMRLGKKSTRNEQKGKV